MDIDNILNSDGYHAKNPAYKKGNGQPEFIMTDNPLYAPRTSADMFMQAAKSGDLGAIGEVSDYERYIKRGITPSKLDTIEDYQKTLADRQSGWSKAFNALAQTLVSEIGLGTIGGFADLFDFVASDVLGIGEDDYKNPVSDLVRDWQDTFRNEVAPIWVDPNKNIQTGGLGDFGWWMSHVPDIASAITLLIPARGVTAGASKLGKTLHADKAASKVRRWAGGAKRAEQGRELNAFQRAINNPINKEKRNAFYRIGTEALLMRTMENYQEARDVNIQTYDNALEYFSHQSDQEFFEWIDANRDMFTDDELSNMSRDRAAKTIAKRAADRTFAMDFSNIIFDVIQLYGLKNLGKGIKQLGKSGGGAAVQAEQRASIEAAGNLAEEGAQKAVQQISKGQRILTSSKDFIKGNLKTILEESTEGIEEGVNYIAQQEGITYGKALLDGKGEDYQLVNLPAWSQWATLGLANVANFVNVVNTWNKLQNPLGDYLKDAEMQESVFWGMLGGWAFGIGGNTMNSYGRYRDSKALKKKMQVNPLTGEKLNIKDDDIAWLEMLEMPEAKAAKLAIKNRQFNLEKLKSDLQDIENGINIYAEKEENGSAKKFTSVDEKEAARIKAINEYKTNMVLDAINSGTYDMLLDYWKSDNVKKAMTKIGLTNEATVDTEVDEFVKLAEDIRKMYDEQSSAVMSQVEYINATAKNGYEIPLGYVQEIAKKNVNRLLEIREFDQNIAALNNSAAVNERTQQELHSDFNSTNERALIKIQHLLDLYTQLDTTERKLRSSGKNDFNTVNTLEHIKEQKKYILDSLRPEGEITGTNTDNYLFNVVAAMSVANDFEQTIGADGRVTLGENSFKKTDDEIVADATSLLGMKTNLTSDVIMNQAKALLKNYKNKRDGSDLVDRDTDLFNKYHRIADLELSREVTKSYIATTRQQITDEVDYLHNRNNVARKKVIEQADNIIRDVYSRHINEPEFLAKTQEIFGNLYKKDKQEARRLAEELMGEEDATKFIDALDTLNLSGKANSYLYQYLTTSLAMIVESNKQSAKSSSTSENPVSSEEFNEEDNSSEEERKDNSEEENGQIEGVEAQQSPTTEEEKAPQTTEKDKETRAEQEDKTSFTYNDHTYNVVKNSDRTYTIVVPNNDVVTIRNLIKDDLATVVEGVDQLEDELTVTEAPVVELEGDNSILKKIGKVDKLNPEEDTATETAVETPTGEKQPAITPKPTPTSGEQTQSPDTISSTGVEEQAPIINTMSQEEIDATIKGDIQAKFASKIDNLAQTPIDEFERVAEEVKQELLNDEASKQFNQEDIDRVYNKLYSSMKAAVEKMAQIRSKLQQEAYGLSTVANESRVAEIDIDANSDLFRNTFDAFMKEYQKVTFMPKVDGKLVVNLENVLRICNTAFGSIDSKMARRLYDLVKYYLNTDYGMSKYIIQDGFRNKEDVIADAAINAQQLRDKLDGTETSEERVDIYSLLDMYKDEGNANRSKFFKIFDNLQIGDKLQVVRTSYEYNKGGKRESLSLIKDGVVIGELPVPHKSNNGYYVYNNGWLTDVTLDGNGKVVSKSKDIIEHIFLSDDAVAKDLREILLKYSLSDNADNSELLDEFTKNPIIKQLIDDSVQLVGKVDKTTGAPLNILYVNPDTKTVDADKVLDMLARLWKYSNVTSSYITKDENASAIRNSINRWYEKRYETYNNISALYSDENVNGLEVEITKMNAGELTKAYDDNKDGQHISITSKEGYEQANYPSDAIADRSVSKLGIMGYDDGLMAVSGYGYRKQTGYSANDTELVVFDNNKHPYFAKAVGAIVEFENKEHTKLAALVNAASNHIALKVKQLAENINSEDAYRELEEALNNVFASYDNHGFGIFRAKSNNISIKKVKNGNFEYIEVSNNTLNFKIYKHDNFATKLGIAKNFGIVDGTIQKYDKQKTEFVGSKGVIETDIVRDIVTSVNQFIASQTTINISRNGIESDIKQSSTNGFFKRTENGIVVDIPAGKMSYHAEAASYNDFLLDNDLVKINLQKINDKNFVRRGENQLRNQTLYVSLPKAKRNVAATTETKTTNSRDVSLTTSVTETRDNIKQIMDSNKNSAGKEILKEILDENDYNRFVEATADDDIDILDFILPKNITYKPELNWYDSNTGKSKGSTAFVRGNRKEAKYSIYDDSGKLVKGVRFKKGEDVIIGPRLLNYLADSKKSNRYLGLRKLIHEQLHNTIQENEETRTQLLNAISEVYSIFYEHLKKDLADNSITGLNKEILKNINDSIKNYKGDRLLEEFLVESLTNIHFVNYLNSIKVGEQETSTNENLFTKIIKALAKFFGWNIEKDSLYAKEFNAIADILTNNQEVKPADTATDEDIIEAQTTSPVEESKNENEPTSDNEFADALNIIDSIIEEDEESNMSDVEEVDIISKQDLDDEYKYVPNINSLKDKMPDSVKSKFEDYSKDGSINSKCN